MNEHLPLKCLVDHLAQGSPTYDKTTCGIAGYVIDFGNRSLYLRMVGTTVTVSAWLAQRCISVNRIDLSDPDSVEVITEWVRKELPGFHA